jgi:hypothetical protein
MASDAACVLGLSAALQLAQVPLSPSWLVAAALSEAIKVNICDAFNLVSWIMRR